MIELLFHFYRKGCQPFQSLSALPEDEALRRMREMYVEGAANWERFKDPAGYLKERRETEAWLRAEFIARGGAPRSPYPIYMMLGRPRWLELVYSEQIQATTADIQVPLSIFGENDLSFTYPDSMVTRFITREKNPDYYLPEYHGRVFTFPEIRAIIEQNGLPGERWGTSLPLHLANYIEVQVWNRDPLIDYAKRFLGIPF